jgi:hypothetical protein
MKLAIALICVLAGRLCLAQSPPDTTTTRDLDAFWRDLDARFEEPLSPALRADWPGIGALDSLGMAGDREMQALLSGRRWRTTLSPLSRFAFNRCEGLRPGLAVTHRHLVRHGATLGAGLGYGIARERFVWDVSADLPLAIAAPTNAEGRPTSRSWPGLSLEMRGGDQVVAFGGEHDVVQRIETILDGSDPLMYHGARGGGADLVWRPVPTLAMCGGWFYEEQYPLPVVTDWTLLGNADDVPENWAADRLITRAATLGATVDLRRHQLSFGVERHDLDLADPASSIPDGALWTLRAGLRASWIMPQGHEVMLRGDWRRNDRAAPLQSREWLGGAQSLRGYPVRELEGDDAALATLDLRGGFDPLRALHIPLLSRLGLQPIAFADWGRTTRGDPSASSTGDAGWRADVGIGLGRLIGAPGIGGHLRLYAAKPVFNGESDRPWRFLLMLEP